MLVPTWTDGIFFFFFFLCKHADYDISGAGAVQKISELAFKLMLAVHCMYERLFGPLVQQDEVRERRVLMLIWGTTFKIPQILKLPFSPWNMYNAADKKH